MSNPRWMDELDPVLVANHGIARALVMHHHPGINEVEAMAYARGIAKGMAMAGCKGADAELRMAAERTRDKLLDAGCSYTGVGMVESLGSTKQ